MERRTLRARATALSYLFVAAGLTYLTVRWLIGALTPPELPQHGEPLPPMARTIDRWFDVVTTLMSVSFALLPLACLVPCLAAARARVLVTCEELHVVNPFSRHRLAWSEVVRVELERSGVARWRTFVHTTRDTIQAHGIRSPRFEPLPLVFGLLSAKDTNPFKSRDRDPRPRYIADPYDELERACAAAHQRLSSSDPA